jgi:hypothetical protein
MDLDAHEFERLRAAAKAHGDKLGVSTELQMNDLEGSSFNPAGKTIVLRVFRLMPGQLPVEYAEGSGYALGGRDLRSRLEKDIEIAAQKLYAVP